MRSVGPTQLWWTINLTTMQPDGPKERTRCPDGSWFWQGNGYMEWLSEGFLYPTERAAWEAIERRLAPQVAQRIRQLVTAQARLEAMRVQ